MALTQGPNRRQPSRFSGGGGGGVGGGVTREDMLLCNMIETESILGLRVRDSNP